MVDSADFHFEVVKLLAKIALVDGVVQDFEKQALLRYAKRHDLGEEDREALQGWLDGEEPTAPDLTILRARRQQVLIAVQSFLLADSAVNASERMLLAQVEAALS